ncbi:MAG: presqualene diphosphate synthase HpnD [Betaproteobacteria bacterium]|nr:presqualene diphosphate synthase HpnD [Betaproteobacteria bacterium]
MTPDAYCRQKAAAGGSSLYYSVLFLPPERRRAITALYAFRRELDEVVSESHDASLAQTRLEWWRVEVAKMFAGEPQHPVTRALAPALAPYGITALRLTEIIDGVKMDLDQTRYLDFAGLERYCRLGSGAVAVLTAGICGYRDERTLDYANNLGVALQLAKIVRDIGADARNNRIYLPMDELRDFGVPAADLLNARHSEAFVRLMQFQGHRAEAYFAKALEALPAQDRRAQRPGLIMAAISRALLVEIGRDDFQVLTHRTSLTPVRKFWIAWKTWVTA